MDRGEYQTGSFDCPHCRKEHPGYISKCPSTGRSVDRAFKMQGELLEGRYRVGRMIMSGGMAVVYEGVQENLGRRIAIKFLRADDQKEHQPIHRFQNEAMLAASIGHTNIVDVFDMGETGEGIHYIVMEYLQGQDLGDLLVETERLPAGDAVALTLQMLAALRAVHAEGIIHRDLKPENVFVVSGREDERTVKVLDFGISVLARTSISLTMSGTVFGSPGYISPEQARGVKDVDQRADLYSAGVILYELLTGHLPFDAEGYNDMLIALTTEEPVHISRRGVDLDVGLQEIVMRAILRDRDERFQSADEMLEAIRPYTSAERSSLVPRASTPAPFPDTPFVPPDPVHAERPSSSFPPVSLDTSPPPQGRSWQRPVLLSALAVLLLAAAGTGAYLFRQTQLLESLSRSLEARASSTSAPAAVPIAVPGVPIIRTLTLEGLVPGSLVYVDSTLHPERPLSIVHSPEPRTLRVEADGHETWERQVIIASDVAMSVSQNPIPPPETGKKASRKKRSKKTETVEEPPEQDPSRIDKSYPGL
jgi:serine/threonine-protein kinase